MDSTKRLGIAIVGLAVISGLVFQQSRTEKEDRHAHSLEAAQSELPSISIDEDTAKGIDTIELVKPPELDDEGKPKDPEAKAVKVVLAKSGEDKWELKEPVTYPANNSNVKSLIKNLSSLKITEQVSTLNDSYEKFGLTDEGSLHVLLKKGDEVLLDAHFGNTGSRGQMTRVEGKDGVYAVKGFSKYLYARDVKAWRDKAILKFEEDDAVKVTIKNETGEFKFDKGEKEWSGTLNGKPIERFKPSKVADLVRAYKALNASEFGDDKKPEDVGLAEPTATLAIELKGGSGKLEIKVGDKTESSGRWIIANSKQGIFGISSWSAEWATSDATKFQEKAPEDKAATTKNE